MTNRLTEYFRFVEAKSHIGGSSGFKPLWLPDFLFDFQTSLVDWSIHQGRGAIFADCGLGKTIQQLVWGENVVRHTNKPVLALAPLGVAAQTVQEAGKFGIEAERSHGGAASVPRIVVSNYERLHLFDPNDFGGVIGDESSILKNFMGVRRKGITEFVKKVPHRLFCTATAAPNDYVELGTHSEALGYLGHMDMLARFFKNDDKTLFLMGTKYGDFTQKGWRFKAHAEVPFWRWVCSWARACRKPSDIGDFSDADFVLPELILKEHTVKARSLPDGYLFDVGAQSLEQEREEQKRTVKERCERAAELLGHKRPGIAWCHLNEEGDLLEDLIPGAAQVSGSDAEEKKEETFAAFVAGEVRVLVTKPKCGGFGLNFQHCAHHTFFPSHSFEQWYQCIRRSWRFGQNHAVRNDIVGSEGSAGVLANLKRKQAATERMFAELVRLMGKQIHIERSAYGNEELESPSWL
jgi:hypothetical protein